MSNENNLEANRKETGTKYSRVELKAAFDRVADPINWKNPIDAIIRVTERDVTTEAIIFFAGCLPEFENFEEGETVMRVRAVGYYAAVGA